MDGPILFVKFYRSSTGNEPVREFLLALATEDRKAIGTDIKTVQFGWPLGMPLVRKLSKDLWEVRSDIASGTVRILFTIHGSQMLLLHALIKKTNKLPAADLQTARARLRKS
jgi:phage-related protein